MIELLVVALVTAVLGYALISFGGTRPARGRQGGRGGSVSRLSRTQVAERWSVIEAMAAGGGNGLRQAVSEADKLLDHVMRSQGFRGETFAERLKAAQSRLSNREAVWQAHKLRNALAHEVGFDLVPSHARSALDGFKKALKDLGGM